MIVARLGALFGNVCEFLKTEAIGLAAGRVWRNAGVEEFGGRVQDLVDLFDCSDCLDLFNFGGLCVFV